MLQQGPLVLKETKARKRGGKLLEKASVNKRYKKNYSMGQKNARKEQKIPKPRIKELKHDKKYPWNSWI